MPEDDIAPDPRRGDHRGDTMAPRRPGELGGGLWWGALKRAIGEFRRDNLSDWAAALTYYGVLSMFPALLVIVSLVGLAGTSVSQSLITNVKGLAPGAVKQILTTALGQLQHGQATAGVMAIVGLAVALWSASAYVAAFIRASNVIYDVPERRPIWKTLPIRVAVTLIAVVLLAASAIAVVFTGALAAHAGKILGISSTVVTVWDIAKWPLLLIIISFLFALLYWASPNAKRGFRWVTPGVVLALIIWILASAAFTVYVANFGSYNKTYGSLATVIIFLVWLWISNIAILLGAELNAELQRGRAIAAGHPETKEPYVQPRDTNKHDHDS
jgi:YihY family inner membrane protein